MKKLLLVAFVLHVLLEGLVGVLLIVAPYKVAPHADPLSLTFVINYGFAAVTMASVVFWGWSGRDNFRIMGVALGILATFHTALAAASTMMLAEGGSPAVLVIHAVMAVLFWLLFARRRQWCVD
ncbi:hypothetical protein [Pseudomaricurvus sp.]|uniref:hypothetical protein n=1 Tax=Pseudomaricurvus sp. TaxID=2004510 RepID=UPI003F6C0DF9